MNNPGSMQLTLLRRSSLKKPVLVVLIVNSFLPERPTELGLYR